MHNFGANTKSLSDFQHKYLIIRGKILMKDNYANSVLKFN